MISSKISHILPKSLCLVSPEIATVLPGAQTHATTRLEEGALDFPAVEGRAHLLERPGSTCTLNYKEHRPQSFLITNQVTPLDSRKEVSEHQGNPHRKWRPQPLLRHCCSARPGPAQRSPVSPAAPGTAERHVPHTEPAHGPGPAAPSVSSLVRAAFRQDHS